MAMRTLQEHIRNLNALSEQEGTYSKLDVRTVAEMLVIRDEKIEAQQEYILETIRSERAEQRRKWREETEVRI